MSSPRELLEDFLAERALYVSESTVRDDRFHLRRFFRFLESEGVEDVAGVGFDHLDRYRVHLETVPGERGAIASPSYCHKSLAISRHFLNSCEELVLVDFSLYQLPHVVKAKPVKVPSPDQVKLLLEAPNSKTPPGLRDRLILESFYTMALRRRESQRLSLADISLNKKTVRVMGKRQRERILPLADRLAKLLSVYIKDVRPHLRPLSQESALWISPQTGKRLGFTYLCEIVVRNAKRLGLGKMTPHLLRHAGATHMLEGGARLEDIQLFLGHSSPTSTERYTHVDLQQLKAVHQRSHPRCGDD